MTLQDIMKEAWAIARETNDDDNDRLWSTAEMKQYINRVYRNIARQTRCIRDAETATDLNNRPLCRIPVAPAQDLAQYALPDSYAFTIRDMVCEFDALSLTVTTDSTHELHATTLLVSDALTEGTTVTEVLNATQFTISSVPLITGGASVRYHAWITPLTYTLNPLILDIDEVKWTNKAWKLRKVSVVKWQINPWWEWVVGMPTEFATDYSNNKIALNYRSYEEDTLRLIIRRLPLKDLVNNSDEPEFRSNYHDYMLNGVLAQMYSKQDSQCFDGEKKMTYEAKYAMDIDYVKRQERILDQKLTVNNSVDAFR